MSCKQKSELSLFVCIVTVAFYKFQICDSVSVGRLTNLDGFGAYQGKVAENIKPKNDARPSHSGGRVILRGAPPPNSDRSGLPGRPSQTAVSPGKPPTRLPKLDASDNNLAQKATGLFWTSGNATTHERPSSSDNAVVYQADFPGFKRVQGRVFLSDSSPHFAEWLAMRPSVQCDNNIMTFTASGQGHTHLLIEREGASPISLFQLPPYCGYSVRTLSQGLVMMAPYDGCYITQEDGNYVLPMLWFDSPLKLSCPVQIPTLSHSILHCSLYGMVVQIHAEEDSIWTLAVMMKGEWAPFVSAECAYRVDSQPDQLIFFAPISAPCVTVEDAGLYLLVLLDGKKYTLSCPVSFPFPFSPPLSPGDPVTPVRTTPSPPQPPTQEQILQFPDYFHYLYPGLQYPQLPQPARPSQPTPGSPPGPQSQQSLDPVGPGQLPYSPGDHPNYSPRSQPSAAGQAISAPNLTPGQDGPPYHLPILPVGPPQYPSGLYFPHVALDYPPVTPAPTHSTESPTTLPHKLPQYDPHVPHYPSPTAAPVTQRPVIPPPPPPPPPPKALKQPRSPQFPVGPVDPSDSYNPYDPYGPIFDPEPGPDVWPPTTTTTRTMAPKQPVGPQYSSGLYYPHGPFYFPPPSPPPAKGAPPSFPQIPQHHLGPLDPSVTAQQAICPPYGHTICSYYPYPHYHPPYPPHYHPFYPSIPLYPSPTPPGTKQPTSPTLPSSTPTTTTTTTSVASTPTQPTWQPFTPTQPTWQPSTPTQPTWQPSTPTQPTPQPPSLQCLKERMRVFLPSAHPDSIQIRDRKKTWLSLSSVLPRCGYVLHTAKGSGVTLDSPLPACYSQPRTPTTLSLLLRFWDLAMARYRTLELQCSYQHTPQTTTTTINPVTPSTTQWQTGPSVPRPKLFCFPLHMTVELPPGPISGIVVKDIKGNQINLKDSPEDCGYTASKGKNGKIRLNFPLSSHCHMSVEGNRHLINIVYMTVNGRREAQLLCPVSIPVSSQECNLPSEQRLPCGPSSLSQTKCLSMGCCFSKRRPVCYYPMDECTVDRHFVFSVPASLTEPPLSPALLVAAGNSTCIPQKVTSDYALFKIPLDGCGTRRVEVGKTVIYMVEILSMVKTITLNYATITRDSPVRLLIECRYKPGSVATVGFLVKGPSLGPAIHSQGVFGAQLRIAKDAEYSSYYPQYHQPLQMLLGKPLYLEVRLLNPPDPNLVLLVHYCVAYPRSGQAVWVLLYNGCPNPLDPAPQQAVLSPPAPPSPQGQTRRFTISTFQFLPAAKSPDLDEEIYFMCSTEVCSSHDDLCVEGCFGQ